MPSEILYSLVLKIYVAFFTILFKFHFFLNTEQRHNDCLYIITKNPIVPYTVSRICMCGVIRYTLLEIYFTQFPVGLGLVAKRVLSLEPLHDYKI